MYGSNIDQLEVVLKLVKEEKGTTIWKQNTTLPPVWFPAQIDIIADAEYQVNKSTKFLQLPMNRFLF